MAEVGIPLEYVKWINGFLLNRQARVRLNGETSGSVQLKQGVPQGCVLSPILFLFYINNLAKELEVEDAAAWDLVFSMFADDVTVVSRDSNRERAVEGAQWAVDTISTWSEEWKLTLNATKSEVTFFSVWSREAKYTPSININGTQIPFNPNPKLLGVKYDRTLSFEPHVKEITRAATSKLRLLGAVGNSKWGWDKERLVQLYYAYVRSKPD